MLKGRLLGFVQNVADSFCYLIPTNTSKEGDRLSILSRSVVHPRYKDEDPPVYTSTDEKKLIIFKNDKVIPLEDPEPEIIKMIIDFSAKYTAIEKEGPVTRKRDDSFDESIVEVLGPLPRDQNYIRNHSISRLPKQSLRFSLLLLLRRFKLLYGQMKTYHHPLTCLFLFQLQRKQ